jgi:hypothetical protein
MAAYGSVGTLFSCVDLTSTATADLTWRLWRKTASGKKEDRTEVTSHLALDVLNEPNDFYSREEYVEPPAAARRPHRRVLDVMATNAMGWPESLWPVRPDRIQPGPVRGELPGRLRLHRPRRREDPARPRPGHAHPHAATRSTRTAASGPCSRSSWTPSRSATASSGTATSFVNGAEPGGDYRGAEGIMTWRSTG